MKILNAICKFILDVLTLLIVLVVIASIGILFMITPIRVDGNSMEPVIKDGDIAIAVNTNDLFGDIERFDIVVVNTMNKLIIKRVVGLPGETIEYIDNKLYVDGEYIEEPFLSKEAVTEDFSYTVEHDSYFCLGDNRSISKDSRFYGSFGKNRILCRGLSIVYPFEDFSLYFPKIKK